MIPLLSRSTKPNCTLHIILYYTLTVVVKDSKVKL